MEIYETKKQLPCWPTTSHGNFKETAFTHKSNFVNGLYSYNITVTSIFGCGISNGSPFQINSCLLNTCILNNTNVDTRY